MGGAVSAMRASSSMPGLPSQQQRSGSGGGGAGNVAIRVQIN